ncbi:MAG: hypothetical protein ACUVUC_11045 [Thermoguttaceae bacterium]
MNAVHRGVRSAGIWAALMFAASQAAAQKPVRSNQPDPARVAQIAVMLPEQPQGVGRPIADRLAWQAASKGPGFAQLLRSAESLRKRPMPELPDELYLDYSRTGNRDRYQRVFSERRNRFGTLVLAECLEGQGRFVPAIEQAIRAVAAEKSWVLPAHDGDLRNFEGRVVDIDLSAAATGANLATADYWLGEKLSPETRKLLRGELERRIFAPFEGLVKRGRPAMGWLRTTNNWNAVCLAGVTAAALSTIEDRQRRAFFVAAAEKHIQHFLDGFTPDGYCSEGLGYWNYGFGHFMLLAEGLFQATGGKLDLWEWPKVRQIAQFGRRIEILPGVCPAFADCHVEAQPNARLMAFVSRRFGFGWTDWERRGLLLAPGPSRDLLEFGITAFDNSASRRPAAKPAQQGLRDWFADAGVLICRPAPGNPEALGVALKGGHNAEHHNHNDVGSFVVAIGRSTPLVDPGSEIYTARTFSARRYESNVLNSFGHPVPRVAGRLQRTGRDAAARVLKAEFTDRADTLVLDLRAAYDLKELDRLERTFVFSREGTGSLAVTDEVQFASPKEFETALVTFERWRVLSDQALLVGEGPSAVKVEITATGAPTFRVQAAEIREDLPGRRTATRLGIGLIEPVKKASLRLTIRRNQP